MPVEYSILPDQGFVLTRAWADVTSEEVLDHQRWLSGDRAFDPNGMQLVDLSQVDELGLSSAAVRQFVDGDPWAPGARRAFVAPNDLAFGVARMHEILLGGTGQQIMVFRSLSQAQDWLGVQPDDTAV